MKPNQLSRVWGGVNVNPLDPSSGGETAIDLVERSWLPRHCQGDPDAFPELVAAYRTPIYSYLSRCGVGGVQRDDLFQEIFLKIHRSASRFDPERSLHPWVFTIVANTVRNHFRGLRVRQLVSRSLPGPRVELHDASPDAQRVATAKETAGWLPHAIGRLPLKQRQVLLLACVHELPLREVGEALGMPVNTVKTCLRRAREKLGNALARREQSPVAEESS